MHGQDPPVIHRDIQPSNLKLTPNGLIKLVDFGLVKQLIPDEITVTVIQGRGTATYTPLEQYGGDTGHTDARSDLYAFSATLYHLLTNQPPLEAKQRFLRPHGLKPPREINSNIGPALEEAVQVVELGDAGIMHVCHEEAGGRRPVAQVGADAVDYEAPNTRGARATQVAICLGGRELEEGQVALFARIAV